jgi:hypothetical protein
MIGMGQIQYRIAQQDQEFLVLSSERSRQGPVIRLGYHAFPHPLPKLSLRGPKLFAITADYESRLLLFLLFLIFVCAHLLFPLAPGLILT